MLHEGPPVRHVGPSGCRSMTQHGGSGRQAFERGQGVERPRGLERQRFRETREPSGASQRGAAVGRNSAIGEDPAREASRRSFSARCMLEGPRGLRHRRQGDQTRQTVVEAIAWPSGRHSRRASVGRLELAHRHGGGHARRPRRGGWRRTTLRRPLVEDGCGSRRQAVGSSAGSALLQPGLSAPGSGSRRSLSHPLLLQHPFRRRYRSTGTDQPRCERPANRAGVGTVGQVRGTSARFTFAGSHCIWPMAR